MTTDTTVKVKATRTKVKATEVKTSAVSKLFCSERELVDLLHTIRRHTFVQFWTKTNPSSSMRKGGNRFYNEVEKINCCSGGVCLHYETMMNNHLLREAISEIKDLLLETGMTEADIDGLKKEIKAEATEKKEAFKAQKLPWGEWEVDDKTGKSGLVVIGHTPKKSQIYTRYIRYVAFHQAEPVYRWKESGIDLTDDEVAELKTFYYDKKQKPYLVRNVKVNNIRAITINKTHYTVQ
jgi:hypothetical protein